MYSFMWRINCSNPGYIRITISKTEHIPYNEIFTTKFTDSSILITITCISWNNLKLSFANEYVGGVTIPTQVIKYNQCCSMRISKSDCSFHIKLNYYHINYVIKIQLVISFLHAYILCISLRKLYFTKWS
jgi:hypothetical protein